MAVAAPVMPSRTHSADHDGFATISESRPLRGSMSVGGAAAGDPAGMGAESRFGMFRAGLAGMGGSGVGSLTAFANGILNRTVNGASDEGHETENGVIQSSGSPWQVNVRERKLKEKGRKVREPSYTLYLSTPDNQLVLARTLSDIVSLDARLRSKLPSRLPANRPPILTAMQAPSHKPAEGGPSTPTRSRRKPRQVLQTLGRTLSPTKATKMRHSKRDIVAEPEQMITPPGSQASVATEVPASRRQPSQASPNGSSEDDGGFVPINLSTTEKSLLSSLVADSERSAETQLSDYLSALVRDDSVRDSSTWKAFVKVGREDFRGPRIPRLENEAAGRPSGEHALKRVKSDLARHVAHEPRQYAAVHVSPPPSNRTIVAPFVGREESDSVMERRRQSDARREAEEALGLTAQDVMQLEKLANGSSAPATPKSFTRHLPSDTNAAVETPNVLPVAPPEAPSTSVSESPSVPADDSSVSAQPPGEAAAMAEGEDDLDHFATYARTDSKEPEVAGTEVDASVQDEVREEAVANVTVTPPEEPASEADDEGGPIDSSYVTDTATEEEPVVNEVNGDSPTPIEAVPSGVATPASAPPRMRKPRKTTVDDFEILRVLGKGCAGKVLMVRHHRSAGVYAMKSIQKGHVLAHRELQHTLTEQSVLKRVADDRTNPFIVKLWWSFHDHDHLFLVMDFHNGGDLATQLARWGRLGRDRARFYAAEIAEGVIGLHAAGVVYRDLKPENVLIANDGHVVLTDFGLSKQFPREGDAKERRRRSVRSVERETTSTFCGTAEYLAPEVLLGEPYSYEVDWWSFGTMLYEMLTGLTPFWSDDHATMYRRVLHDELTFNEDSRVMDHDTKTLLRGLLQRDPIVRMSGSRIKRHPYFGMIDWEHVYHKRYIPPYVPATDPEDITDTQNFDEAFLTMAPTYVQDEEAPNSPREENGDVEPEQRYDAEGRDVFDGYSYLAPRGDRDSIVEYSDEGEPSETDADAEHEPVDAGTEEAVDSPKPAETDESDLNDSYERTQQASSLRTSSTQPTSLDQDLSSAEPSHGRGPSSALDSLPEDESAAEEGDDWDVVDNPGEGVWDRNGKRGNTLFARGVVDKYKMRMRKGGEPTSSRSIPRFARTGSSLSSLNPSDADASLASSVPTTSSRDDRRRFRLRQKRSDIRPQSPDSARLSERTVAPRKSMSDPSRPEFTPSKRRAKIRRLGLSTPLTLFNKPSSPRIE